MSSWPQAVHKRVSVLTIPTVVELFLPDYGFRISSDYTEVWHWGQAAFGLVSGESADAQYKKMNESFYVEHPTLGRVKTIYCVVRLL